MKMNLQIIRISVLILWLTSVSSKPSPKITNGRIQRLIRQIFYVPPSGESYFNTSVPLSVLDVCTDVCVPFHLCVNGSVVTTGANLFAPRIGLVDEEPDGPQHCGESEICCKLSYDDDDDDDNNITSEEELGSKEITDSEDMDYDDNIVEYKDSWQPKCGKRNFNMLQPRITGDDKAGIYEFPWMVMVLKKTPKSDFYDYQCGGSLIHPSVVMTAAHCVHRTGTKTLHIRAGEYDMEKTDEVLPHQDREIQSVIIHPDFFKRTLLNDIALLVLKAPVQLADNVNTICIPPPNYSFNNDRCLVSGWGKENHSRESRFQTVLKKVELPVIPNLVCQMMFRNTMLGKYFKLDSSFICAGGEYGKDTCKGDGGSPMVCKIKNTINAFYQAGIVSWGIGCSERNIPGAYVNVARYRNWIDTEMKKLMMDSSSYIHK